MSKDNNTNNVVLGCSTITLDSEISNIVFNVIKKAVESGDKVNISGFGMFYPKQCPCCEHNEVAFKSSAGMREMLNNLK